MSLLLTLGAAIAGGSALHLLRVPAGAMIGAMIGVALVNIMSSTPVTPLPGPGRLIAYGAIGWMLGQDIGRGALATLSRVAWPVALVVVLIVVAGGLLGLVLHTVAGLDPATAYLATSPGGISQMAILASDSGANASLVAAVHLARVVTVVLLTPLIAQWIPGQAGTG
jgi:membrane AbrB-like protein